MADYQTFTAEDAMRFADEHSGLFGEHSKLTCEELGEDNLNLAFRVSNDKGRSLVVKQALPYAYCVGESWPLTIDRARIEAEILIKHGKLCPDHTVEVLHFDAEQAAILFEDLTDYRLLRSELIAGKKFPHLAQQMATYLAHTLYYTSDFALTGPNKKQQVKRFLNPDMCLITEDLYFSDPYCNHERNVIHSEIRAEAQQLWHDEALQAEVAQLKADFLSKPQALLHGNLHSSSIFINDDNCKAIAAGFGFCGPIGFDVGSLIANLLLNYLGHFGLSKDADSQQQQQDYLLLQVQTLWQSFAEQFKQLMAKECREPNLQNGVYQQRFMQQVFTDTLGYAGCELIRRTVGMAHVADLDQIADTALRAQCEIKAVHLGRELILQRHELSSIEQVQTLLRYLQ
jgi:5-methylthioribose kinase